MTHPPLGTRIRTIRLLRGLTQAQMSQQIGTSRSLLAAFEVGDANPTSDTTARIEGLFNLSLTADATDQAFAYLLEGNQGSHG